MAIYFLDTSAIVKRYFPERGHTRIVNLCDPTRVHNLYISQVALVETIAAICRREREQSITLTERNTLITAFRQDSRDSYNIWSVTTEIYIFAGDLCRSHRLRAYDAIQLACVIALREYTQANQAPEPIFICADHALLDIATVEGLTTENPNDYL